MSTSDVPSISVFAILEEEGHTRLCNNLVKKLRAAIPAWATKNQYHTGEYSVVIDCSNTLEFLDSLNRKSYALLFMVVGEKSLMLLNILKRIR